MNKYNKFEILYMGTPDFAVPCLRKLIKKNYNICSVITQPDKKAGRGQKIIFSPIKEVALKHNIEIYQPENIKDKGVIDKIKDIKPDIIIVAAYGQILPKEILDIPKFGCINIHASLLPKYRGASPIQYAILNGEKETGVTVMQMGEGLDDGDIISQKSLPISDSENSSTLHDKLSLLGAELLLETIPLIFEGKIKKTPQDEERATFTKIIKKEDGEIKWSDGAVYVERKIRAFYPWPGTFTGIELQNSKVKNLKITKAALLNEEKRHEPGKIFKSVKGKMLVACYGGNIILEKVKLEGKKEISGEEFLRGYPYILNKKFK